MAPPKPMAMVHSTHTSTSVPPHAFGIGYISQSPYKSVNLSCTITNINDKLTNLWENRLLRNDFVDTLCGINTGAVGT